MTDMKDRTVPKEGSNQGSGPEDQKRSSISSTVTPRDNKGEAAPGHVTEGEDETPQPETVGRPKQE